MGIVDYWANAFTPDRRALWHGAIADQDIPLKVRSSDDDSFADAETMVARMDALGIDTLVLPCAIVPDDADAHAYERYAVQPDELAQLVSSHPSRFVGAASFDPTRITAGIADAKRILDGGGCVALHLHTHSWDRPFDHRDLYPFYALAAERGLPVVMQAGASGGRMPSECGRPIGIDRPAMFFEETAFVLSHTGWPWVDEAIAMAQKHHNVYLGTAGYPPHHWPDALVRFIGGLGRGKSLFGTSFPVVGHRHALGRLDALDLKDEARSALLENTARRVFRALPTEGP